MKQFTEDELKKELDGSFDQGYDAGYKRAVKDVESIRENDLRADLEKIRLATHVANQRRELRRLNKQIERLYAGAAAQRRYESHPFEFDTGE